MPDDCIEDLVEPDRKELEEAPAYCFELDRREWVSAIGAGLLITARGEIVKGQESPESGVPASTRLHLGEDGAITVLTGKVEVGQGSRTQILQAAAEELRVAPETLRARLADTAVTPNDGSTAGSRTTPSTVPVVRRACAAAREVLIQFAADAWKVDGSELEVRSGTVIHEDKRLSYADLARSRRLTATTDDSVPRGVPLSPSEGWSVLGKTILRARVRDVVTGVHQYPSDIVLPGMLYGAVLRPPSYGARLESVDLGPARRLGVVAVRDGEFVGCAARTSHQSRHAVKAIASGATWRRAPHPSSEGLASRLRAGAQRTGEGRRGPRRRETGDIVAALQGATELQASYSIPYVQHVPMEPRAAVAQWNGQGLTVWTGTQRPFGVRAELAAAFRIAPESVRVIVPDTGGGFGGKHTGEAAIEAARLARGAQTPVSLRWTRAEEFAWAYFRPAAAFDVRAGLIGKRIVAWDFTAFNPGTAAIESPYAIPNQRTRYYPCDAPLREGSYRGIGATGNNFAREAFMDELAHAAGLDPLEFRLANLDDKRLGNVLRAAARGFGWSGPSRAGRNRGAGLAAGFEKGSYIAICAQVRVEGTAVQVERIVSAFECGAILNPGNLRAQVEGCINQGLGPALTEEIRFAAGQLLNGSLSRYPVPRFRDIPPMETILLDRPDIAPSGAGETPIIAVAPALANAVFAATGQRRRRLPLQLPMA